MSGFENPLCLESANTYLEADIVRCGSGYFHSRFLENTTADGHLSMYIQVRFVINVYTNIFLINDHCDNVMVTG